MIMMDFARTATRDKHPNDSLFWPVAGILTVYLAACAVLLWINAGKKPVVEGRLNQVKVIQAQGKYKTSGSRGIALDKEGNIYIADSRNDRVVVFSSTGRPRRIIGGNSKESDAMMKNPVSVAAIGDTVLFGSYGTGEILVYSRKGKLLDVLPHKEDRLKLPAIHPLVMTSDSKGNLYTGDGKDHFIAVFDPEGKLKLIFGRPGYGETEVSSVSGLAVDEPGRRIIVMSSGILKVMIFNMDGKLMHEVSYNNKGQNVFIAPRGLAYDAKSGTIYIADSILDTVFAVDEQGRILARSPNIGLEYPHGVALGPNGYVYVTQRESGKISVLNP
jgi:DNA-binding beta-propeller fold protein YncE